MRCGPSLSRVSVVIGSRLGEAESRSNSPAWHRYKCITLAAAKHRSNSPAQARCNNPTSWAHDPKLKTKKKLPNDKSSATAGGKPSSTKEKPRPPFAAAHG